MSVDLELLMSVASIPRAVALGTAQADTDADGVAVFWRD